MMTPHVHVPGDLAVMIEAEAAFYLRLRLGPVRAWIHFLTDERRPGRDDSRLLPVYRANGRWHYSKDEVFKFADDFAAEHPEAKPNQRPTIMLSKDVAPTSLKRRVRFNLKKSATVPVTPPIMH